MHHGAVPAGVALAAHQHAGDAAGHAAAQVALAVIHKDAFIGRGLQLLKRSLAKKDGKPVKKSAKKAAKKASKKKAAKKSTKKTATRKAG